MMPQDFVVTLKKERRKSVDFISVLAILLSVFAFLSVSFQAGFRSYFFPGISVFLLLGICLNFYRGIKSQELHFNIFLFLTGCSWFAMPYSQWVGVPLILLSLLEKPAKMPVTISFNGEAIVIGNFFKRKITWRSFNNVMLKDGIITLDFRNNRIMQKELIDGDPPLNESAFNQYCREQLEAASTTSNTH